MSFGTLTEDDCRLAFRRIVPAWFLESLDVRLGTKGCVDALRPAISNGGFWSSPTDSDGQAAADGDERWSMRGNADRAGWRIEIVHASPAGERVIREGVLPWNNLANRATLAACEARLGRGETLPGRAPRRCPASRPPSTSHDRPLRPVRPL